MAARRGPALAVPVDRSVPCFRSYVPTRTPLPTFTTGRPALLVTLTLPEQLEAGHVDFARQLAANAWAYAVEVERRYRGLPPLPERRSRHADHHGCGRARPRRGTGAGGPGAAARRAGGDGMSATAEIRFGRDGTATVQSYVRLTASTYSAAAPTPTRHRS